MSSPAATSTVTVAIVEESPATSLTTFKEISLLDNEEKDRVMCWELFMSPVEDDASSDAIFQLVFDSPTFDSSLIVSNNVPEMGEYVCSFICIVGNRCVLCTGLFILILGWCAKCEKHGAIKNKSSSCGDGMVKWGIDTSDNIDGNDGDEDDDSLGDAIEI